jgi:hypothetical protein
MRISTKVDYAVRTVAELASEPGVAVPATRISDAQAIPLNFLLHILEELQQGGIVRAEAEQGGGFELVGDRWATRPRSRSPTWRAGSCRRRSTASRPGSEAGRPATRRRGQGPWP